MTGLEILETTQEINFALFAAITGVVFALFYTFAAIKGFIKEGVPDFSVAFLGWFVGILTGIFCFCFAPDFVKYETVYKATISDEVSYNEFTKKYEILREKDGIYEIKEIKEDKEFFKWME